MSLRAAGEAVSSPERGIASAYSPAMIFFTLRVGGASGSSTLLSVNDKQWKNLAQK
jgi:hypothetical protein